MPQTWQKALDEYHYAHRNCNETMEFEDDFRRRAKSDLTAWYDVLRWKSPRSAEKVKNNIRASGQSAEQLWTLCHNYVANPKLETFDLFARNLVKRRTVAVAATFPAFICPDRFPMVDTQVAKWAWDHGAEHGLPNTRDLKGGVLYQRHWGFVESWIEWCQLTAAILTHHTGERWRARDVEMAVFTAQRSNLSLNPLR